MKTILILGGARSGKSRLAVEMAQKRGGEVLFVATAEARDDEMKRRVKAHRQTRPPEWKTLEATLHIGRQIKQNIGRARTVLIDCITLLVNNIFEKYGENAGPSKLERAVEAEIKALLDCAAQSDALFIIVSNEVGLGIIPADGVSRLYRDLLGRANQMLAARADEVYLLVAGLPVALKKSNPDIDS
ncbi:MAG: bifunctional adenosylcobinamide kinase/adenosylcobinamide-phosphate guanylyltransferase [Dehalococcoidales bacterium]